MILWTISAALAVGIHTENVPCPVGEDRVKVYYLLSSNEFGGYDSDGATYSNGSQFRQYAISTCIENLYSAYGKDMNRTWSTEEQQQIFQVIKQQREGFRDPSTPEVWERYELAAALYRWEGRPPHFLAQIYMEAAWTARDSAVGIHENLRGPVVADQVLLLGKKELAKELTTEQEKMVVFNLARVAHRNGRSDIRDEYLKTFLSLPSLSEADKKSAEHFSTIVNEIEPKYLRLAVVELEKQLERKPQDGQALYLLGDIHRRLGNIPAAEQYFHRARVTSGLHEEQQEIIQHFFP